MGDKYKGVCACTIIYTWVLFILFKINWPVKILPEKSMWDL